MPPRRDSSRACNTYCCLETLRGVFSVNRQFAKAFMIHMLALVAAVAFSIWGGLFSGVIAAVLVGFPLSYALGVRSPYSYGMVLLCASFVAEIAHEKPIAFAGSLLAATSCLLSLYVTCRHMPH